MLATPGTGDPVECVLRKRRPERVAGRRKLLKWGAEGPIMNSAEVPKLAKPGQLIRLGVGVISDDGGVIAGPLVSTQQGDAARAPLVGQNLKNCRRSHRENVVGFSQKTIEPAHVATIYKCARQSSTSGFISCPIRPPIASWAKG